MDKRVDPYKTTRRSMQNFKASFSLNPIQFATRRGLVTYFRLRPIAVPSYHLTLSSHTMNWTAHEPSIIERKYLGTLKL